MIHGKVHTQMKPKIVVDAKSATGGAMMRESVPSQDRIRERAYQLYEGRGREPGQDKQDWLRAEQEILQRKR